MYNFKSALFNGCTQQFTIKIIADDNIEVSARDTHDVPSYKGTAILEKTVLVINKIYL